MLSITRRIRGFLDGGEEFVENVMASLIDEPIFETEDRLVAANEIVPVDFIRVDVRERAANARYRPTARQRRKNQPGTLKLTRYPRVDLRKRKVILMAHQAGVERSESLWHKTVWKVTGNIGVGPTGVQYEMFDDDVRLVAGNRVDRAPFHGIHFETLGNLAYIEGGDRYYAGHRLGRGTFSKTEAASLSDAMERKVCSLRERGIEPYMFAPHRISGISRTGKPNRQICCSSEPWKTAERLAAKLGIPVPGENFTFGGLPIPKEWRSEAFSHCKVIAA